MKNLIEKSFEQELIEKGFEISDKYYYKNLVSLPFINIHDEEDNLNVSCQIRPNFGFQEYLVFNIIPWCEAYDYGTGFYINSVKLIDSLHHFVKIKSKVTIFSWSEYEKILKKVVKVEKLQEPIEPYLEIKPMIRILQNSIN